MEENVALDTTKQRKFVKSIKGIKKLIKVKNEKVKCDESEPDPKPKDKIPKRKRPDRGLVYLSHIPHGFYEHEMSQYFKQFGMVTNVRVIRSKRTGNSKGFAFVEFKEPAVAEIVAETMNNYLMGKRLLKAACIPPEKQRPKAMRKHWNRVNNPGRDARLKYKKSYNENKDDEGDLKRARKILERINKTKAKLSQLGIDYDFFTPVDVPEALQNCLKDENSKEIKSTVKEEKISKKDKKVNNLESKDTKDTLKKDKNEKDVKVESENKSKSTVKATVQKEPPGKTVQNKSGNNKKENKNETPELVVNKKQQKKKQQKLKSSGVHLPEKVIMVQENAVKVNKRETLEPVVNKKEQKRKQQKLKDCGVNLPENFITVQENAEDSNSSVEFDSDEYEKMLGDESDVDSDEDSDGGEDSEDDDGDDSEEDDAGSEDDEESEADEEPTPQPKKSKGKKIPIIAVKPQQQASKQKRQAPEQGKGKAAQKPPVPSKKPKFEKHTQQPMKKQFKKKK